RRRAGPGRSRHFPSCFHQDVASGGKVTLPFARSERRGAMTTRLQDRTGHPDITKGVQEIFKAIHGGGVSAQTLELVHLRASQINGCSPCADAATSSKAGV